MAKASAAEAFRRSGRADPNAANLSSASARKIIESLDPDKTKARAIGRSGDKLYRFERTHELLSRSSLDLLGLIVVPEGHPASALTVVGL